MSLSLNKGVEPLHLIIVELSEEVSHLLELLVVGGGIDLSKVDLFMLLLGPSELGKVVVDGVGNLLTDAGLHEVLAV